MSILNKSLLTLSLFGLPFAASALTIPTSCTLDFDGKVNALYQADGVVYAVAKIKGEKTNKFTYQDENSTAKKSKLTTTFAVNIDDANSCGFDSNAVQPLLSAAADTPWQQFQMVNDQRREVTSVVNYTANGYDFTLFAADGHLPDSDLVRPFLFESENGQLSPVKYDISKGQGAAPYASVKNRSMSVSGDGGSWKYQLAEFSSDGYLMTASAYLQETVEFNKNDKVLTPNDKFAIVWDIKHSCDVNKGSCNNKSASTLTFSKAGKVITSANISRDHSNNASNVGLGNFDYITYDADRTMAVVSSILQIDNGYLVAGKSMSGKAMIALVQP